MRYKVAGAWSTDQESFRCEAGVYAIQRADITDTKNGHVYRDGAYRIVLNGKPYKKGKGGTVPWFGEMAWCSAGRILGDLYWTTRSAK